MNSSGHAESGKIDKEVLHYVLSVIGKNLLLGRQYDSLTGRSERMIAKWKPSSSAPYPATFDTHSYFPNLGTPLTITDSVEDSAIVSKREQELDTSSIGMSSIFKPLFSNHDEKFRSLPSSHMDPKSYLQSIYRNYPDAHILPILVPYPIPMPIKDSTQLQNWTETDEQVTLDAEFQSTSTTPVTDATENSVNLKEMFQVQSQAPSGNIKKEVVNLEDQFVDEPSQPLLESDTSSGPAVSEDVTGNDGKRNRTGKRTKQCRRKYLKTISSLKKLSRFLRSN